MSTEILSVETTICALYEQLCDVTSPVLVDPEKENVLWRSSNYGMLFTVEIDADCGGYVDGEHHPDWEGRFRRYLHIIILRGRQVFVAKTEKLDWKQVDPAEFKNTSNHDSCWRSDGLNEVFETYIESWKEAYKNVPSDRRPAPIAAGIRGSISPFLQHPITFVKVEREYIEEDGRRYWMKLTKINKVNFKITLETEGN